MQTVVNYSGFPEPKKMSKASIIHQQISKKNLTSFCHQILCAVSLLRKQLKNAD
jgi:hypothetical protein